MKFENSQAFAQQLDREDKLKEFRSKFYIPRNKKGESIYLIGNSLGLQPRIVNDYIQQELQDWATLGGNGHLQAKNPWVTYHKMFKESLAMLTGSFPGEVTAMNSLTTNLHLLMISFYRPTAKRYKIIVEKGAFSSDLYAVETQAAFHGFDPSEAIIELEPSPGEFLLKTADIVKEIQNNQDDVALILLGGVNFYTGQAFDMKEITEAGHRAGAIVGFDLAHAIGNIKLELHEWKVDFAVWCSYKYLNSGPGGVAGAFVHEQHFQSKSLHRLGGWWGHIEEERFRMEKGFKPVKGVDGWQLSNVPILSMATHKASLDIFVEAGMENLLKKSQGLTAYLEFLLNQTLSDYPYFKIITSSNPRERGCQLSLYFESNAENVFQRLIQAGIVVDMRNPNVIRVTPVPLYNTFEEVYTFYKKLDQSLKEL